jgi:hypothetical protein
MERKKQFVFKASGSALLMTIVLTVMLAAVAVMFVAVARMDRAATSNIADNKNLDTAAMSIIEMINRELVCDVPGVARNYYKSDVNFAEANFPQYYEYKDYPDACDAWLASSQPYVASDGIYKWGQITDLTYYLKKRGYETNDVTVKPVGYASNQTVIREYPIFDMNEGGVFYRKDATTPAANGISADADGDGIADSKWIEVSNLRTSSGRVLAAIRIIDNSAMVNVNTAIKFDPTSPDANKIDGTSPMQINLKGLLKGTENVDTRWNDANFTKNVIWDFNNYPENGYLPFDVSDELELRYRYCINSKFKSKFEKRFPATTEVNDNEGTLYNGDGSWGVTDWCDNIIKNNLDRRHFLTTYNCSRITDPNGDKMFNINDVNSTNLTRLYNIFRKAYVDPNIAAQIAVNIKDYRDTDSQVSDFNVNGKIYYGFESPSIYISEMAFKKEKVSGVDVNSFAVELYKTEANETPDNSWWLIGDSVTLPSYAIQLSWSGSKQYHVLYWNNGTGLTFDPDCSTQDTSAKIKKLNFKNYDSIILARYINNKFIVVDMKNVPSNFTDGSGTFSVERDITKHKCIRRLWQDDNGGSFDSTPTLGKANDYNNVDNEFIQAHPKNRAFTNIGELGMIFKLPAYYDATKTGNDAIGYASGKKTELAVRLNLADGNLSPVFNYLTALRMPNNHETRVKGRININTAPPAVIAQLPWITDVNLAKQIVKYRDDKVNGFTSIRQLVEVNDMDYYKKLQVGDQPGFPDLTPGGTTGDGAKDDFEERDLIFARISDLVTIRSDVFTAYILVRIGTDGPQKRYIAILDRSEVKKPGDKVIIRAFQQVPDAR